MLAQLQKLEAQVKEDGAALGQKPRDSEQVGAWVGGSGWTGLAWLWEVGWGVWLV